MTTPVQYHYGAFPPVELDWQALIPLIGPASAAVARYDGVIAAIPNRIEGTQATMSEVLEFEAEAASSDLSESRREDIHEVLNYRKAMRLAEEQLETLPLSLRLVRNIHRQLLQGLFDYRRNEHVGRTSAT